MRYDARGLANQPGDETWPIRRGEMSDYEPASVGPLYDCGGEDCAACQRAFGPDRRHAIERERRRAAAYAARVASQGSAS